jgi:hypothetical protein
MEPELWAELSAAISAVQRQVRFNPRDTHPTALIVRVHLWAALHDRPTSWACDPRHWTDRTRPPAGLPDQSTMSRRTRRMDFEPFLELLGRRLGGGAGGGLVRVVDGKPLELPNHTTDRDAGWGRGVSRTSVGYKLHAVWRPGAAMPDAFAVTPLDACEKQMAFRMAKRLGGGGGGGGGEGEDLGYLLGDAHYDASWLFDACRHYGLRLVCPRPKPGSGLGHRYQSPDRLRAIDLLEPPAGLNPFGPALYRLRPGVEREFSQLTSFGGGLGALPTWVRRIWRVRNWVWAKLLVNAARVRRNKRTCAA